MASPSTHRSGRAVSEQSSGTAVPVLTATNLVKAYQVDGEQKVAVADVSFEVGKGEFVCVVGPSGAGKTTLLRCLSGLMPPTGGQALFEGQPIDRVPDRLSVVFQDYSRSLFPWSKVGHNIELPLKVKGVAKSRRRAEVEQLLDAVGLAGAATRYPWQLSGGMQQRVAIARAYVLDPEVLLMDEPFGALDAQTRVVMQEELVRLARVNPRTVLFITHAVEEAVYLADRVAIMTRRPGRIKEVLDVRSIRETEGWDRLTRIEDVMDLESFVHLRTRIWKSLREEKSANAI
jgi:NitT/TauT family transport system ATP-binding protein